MNKKRMTGNTGLPVFSLLLLMMPLWSSCSQQDDLAVTGNGEPQPLSFTVSESGGWDSTRGIALNSLSGAFGLIGAEYDLWDDGQAPTLMYNDAAFGSEGAYKTSMAYVPQRSKTMSFFAYFPYSSAISSATNALTFDTGAEDAGFPRFIYKVPEDVSKQNDLMVAMAHETFGTNAEGRIVKLSNNTEQNIELQFYHLLSAVKFKINNDFDRGKITRVALTNLNYKGEFSYGEEDGEGNYVFDWTEKPNDKRACYANLNFQLTGKGEEGGTGTTSNNLELTDVNETFLVMPQTLNTGVKIQITYNNGNEDFNLEYPIGLKTKDSPITFERAAITTFYLYVDAIHRINAKVTVSDWGTGYTFDGGVSDEGQIELEAVIKDWDDEDSEGNSTATDIVTGAQD